MLMASKRHTGADLEQWARLERLDALNARSARLEKKEAAALDVLRAFLEEGPAYVGVSWGKDSVVVAHLAWRLAESGGPRAPLVRVRLTQWENPDCDRVRDAFLLRIPLTYSEVVRAPAPHWKEDAFSEAARNHGARYVSGVRAEESSVRVAAVGRHGLASKGSARPIGHWSGADVFAYLHKHQLPVHPAYACTFGGTLDRQRIRVGAIGGMEGTGHGRREWEWAYYRDVFVLNGSGSFRADANGGADGR